MKAAISVVNEAGRSIRKISKQFRIPYSYLRDRLKSGTCYATQMGKKPVFSIEQEIEITEHNLRMSKVLYGLTRQEV